MFFDNTDDVKCAPVIPCAVEPCNANNTVCLMEEISGLPTAFCQCDTDYFDYVDGDHKIESVNQEQLNCQPATTTTSPTTAAATTRPATQAPTTEADTTQPPICPTGTLEATNGTCVACSGPSATLANDVCSCANMRGMVLSSDTCACDDSKGFMWSTDKCDCKVGFEVYFSILFIGLTPSFRNRLMVFADFLLTAFIGMHLGAIVPIMSVEDY